MGSDSRVAIVVDSAASLPVEDVRRPQLYVVPMLVTVDGKTYEDGRELSASDFYRILRRSSESPSTSAPPPASFLESFQEAAGGVESVLCLTVASKFSASIDSAQVAAREAESLLPELDVFVLDSGSAAGGEGLVALEAWRVARSGHGLQDVVAAAQGVIPRIRLLAFVDTLYYLWKGGRVPGIAHIGTSLLRIKPLFELVQGQVKTVARPRTYRAAMGRLVKLMHERVESPRIHVTVMHADAPDMALELRRRIETEFTYEELFTSEFTPVMGAHIGPGLLGIAFWCE